MSTYGKKRVIILYHKVLKKIDLVPTKKKKRCDESLSAQPGGKMENALRFEFKM